MPTELPPLAPVYIPEREIQPIVFANTDSIVLDKPGNMIDLYHVRPNDLVREDGCFLPMPACKSMIGTKMACDDMLAGAKHELHVALGIGTGIIAILIVAILLVRR